MATAAIAETETAWVRMSKRNRRDVITAAVITSTISRTLEKSRVTWIAPPRHTGDMKEATNNCPINKDRKKTSRGNRWRMCPSEKTKASKAKTPVIFASGTADKPGIQS